MAGRNSLVALAVALLVLVGCSGAPQPVTRAADEAAKKVPPAAPSPAPAEPAAPAPVRSDRPVVVDPGDDAAAAPVSLVEAARAERERRAHAGKPVAVINDKTLPQYAKKGQITIADTKKKGAAATGTAPAPGTEPLHDEQYWRGRALDIRQRWHRAADDVKALEQRSTELRQKFYLESDTFNRDNQIKPEWDRVLDKLRRAQLDVEATQEELAQFLEEGRAAGVLPGWLREGEDEEPQPRKQEPPPPAQSIEPPVLEPPPQAGDHGVAR